MEYFSFHSRTKIESLQRRDLIPVRVGDIGKIRSEEDSILVVQKEFSSGTIVGKDLCVHAIHGRIKIEVFEILRQGAIISILKSAAMGNNNLQLRELAQNIPQPDRTIGLLKRRT